MLLRVHFTPLSSKDFYRERGILLVSLNFPDMAVRLKAPVKKITQLFLTRLSHEKKASAMQLPRYFSFQPLSSIVSFLRRFRKNLLERQRGRKVEVASPLHGRVLSLD